MEFIFFTTTSLPLYFLYYLLIKSLKIKFFSKIHSNYFHHLELLCSNFTFDYSFDPDFLIKLKGFYLTFINIVYLLSYLLI